MHVLDHQPYTWFLLEDAGALYLDAHCSHSFFDYSVLIALNAAETAAFKSQGRAFVERLASDIHMSAPAALTSTSPFQKRNLTVLHGRQAKAASSAITDWLARQPKIWPHALASTISSNKPTRDSS